MRNCVFEGAQLVYILFFLLKNKFLCVRIDFHIIKNKLRFKNYLYLVMIFKSEFKKLFVEATNRSLRNNAPQSIFDRENKHMLYQNQSKKIIHVQYLNLPKN